MHLEDGEHAHQCQGWCLVEGGKEGDVGSLPNVRGSERLWHVSMQAT